MIKNTLAIAWKDLQLLLKDRGQLIGLFLTPLFFGAFFGMIFGSTPKFDVYLVNHDEGQYGAQVARILYDVDVLDVTELETVEEADKKIADSEAMAAVIIPSDFSRDIEAFDPLNDPATVQVIVDPSTSEYGGMVHGYVNEIMMWVTFRGEIGHGIRTVMDESGLFDELDDAARRGLEAQSLGAIMTQLQIASTDPLVRIESEVLAEAETRVPDSGFGKAAPGWTVFAAFFIVAIIGSALLTEKETGTFRRLLASPIHRGSIILGKMLAYMLVVGLQVLVMLGVGWGFFDMALGDSPLGLALLTLALAFALTSLGMLVAALARTPSQASTVSGVLGIVLALAGGVMTGPPTKGDVLYGLSQLTPHAHAIKAFHKLLVGADAVDILPQVGLLAGVGVLFFVIAVWRFRFE